MNKINFLSYIVVLSMAIAIGSCSDDGGKVVTDQAAADEEAILTYLEENDLLDVTERDDSGIYYQITNVNESGATPGSGEVLSIYYRANALGQQAFDAWENDGSNEPLKLQFNTNSVYPIGLDQSLALMREKEAAIFYIPSALAFGELEDLSSIIPANSVLVVELELDSIQTEAQVHEEQLAIMDSYVTINQLNDTINYPLDSVDILDSDVYYKKLVAGIADDTLVNGDTAAITYLFYALSSYPGGSPIAGSSNEVLSFMFNTGTVISGIDDGIDQMEIEEKALLIVPSNRAYGASAFVIPRNRKAYLEENDIIPEYAIQVSPYQILAMEIELVAPPQIPPN
ncbi:FKBP-type peptidyl-prolyl cis-trans isomerase [Reichenbachiella ulvae]|uniref:peptidylprolyl isomerase n=1 Tax=Reichenbachiella ulvae TaxID=2980104 RepID=A0ABT3CR22_9BACT|nr:FKBP-type peptidyl-prolyl cis-trans isomerase [Reichenbachiella ulvae]MCV9386087.1 FKBP-type peptidyl-prolyl cis-trans isomerase [Reichenbachiella ulvae]